ncbi:MAG: hypothetical protein GY856_08830, partial [bacterium]|nr:hypothetical protein [bacterium]
MSFDFEPLRARLEQRRDHELKQRTRAMSWRDRRDTVLYLIGGSAVVLVIVLSASLVHAGLDLGWFDRPPVRPAPDKRLDGNLRDDVDERPLTAAALHHGRLWVTQSGGTVHRYHPATELWSTAQLDPQLAIRSDLIAMRSGCGADPGSTRAGDCDDPGSLWALSAAGGLVRQRGDWSPVVGESAWLGPAGEPLRSSQLTTAAVSADRRWLLVGSRRQGVGLFDNRRRIWIPVPEEALPAPAVTHLRWWRGRFWIGGPGGLGYLIPGTRLRGKAVSEIAGNILDLDVAAGDGSLWILERHACANEPPGQECRRLTVLTHAYATPAERIAETHRYPAVDFANLSFAHQQGDPLVLAGSAGLYTYDARRHRWQQYLENRVSATLVRPDDALYFGSAGGALRLDEGRETTRWELDEEQVKRLRATPGDEVLALSADGDVDELRTDGSVARVFEAASTTFDPQSFSQAVEVGGKVLFLGRRGALIHDVRRRSYEDVYRGAVPWLFESDVELYGSGGTVFTVARQTRAQIRSARIGALEQVKDLGAVDGPVRLAVDWAAGGLGLLTEDGSVYRATATELRPVIGPPVELRHDQMRDVAVRNDALLVVGPTGLRRYDHNARSWGNWEGTEIARDGFREIELAGNRVLLRTADGRLAELGSDEPIRIGDDRPWKITDDQLSDVRLAGGLLYLAGGGRVHRYDPDRRRTTNRWQLRHAGDATVELIGFHPWGEQPSPVSWAAGRVYLGETALDEQAGPVDSAAFSSGTIRTVREGPGGQRYLKSYTGQSLSEDCVFLHPRGRGRVRDVAALLEGGRWLAMATTEDLQLYSHRARSWYEVRLGNRRVPGDSTIRLGSYLLVVDETGDTARLTFIQLGALKEPDSCAGRVFNVPNKFPTFPVRAWTVDPG